MAFFFIFNPFVLMLLFWSAVQCEEYERKIFCRAGLDSIASSQR
jgi:hypothetical protein